MPDAIATLHYSLMDISELGYTGVHLGDMLVCRSEGMVEVYG